MKRLILVLGIFTLCLSCTPSMRSNSGLTEEQRAQDLRERYIRVHEKINKNEIIFLGGDGSSIESAIIIKGAKHEQLGVDAEYVYLSNKLGVRWQDWQLVSQGLRVEKEKSYDEMKIKDLKTGEEKMYYFDISEFFGRP
jgi:hypothetical protein